MNTARKPKIWIADNACPFIDVKHDSAVVCANWEYLDPDWFAAVNYICTCRPVREKMKARRK